MERRTRRIGLIMVTATALVAAGCGSSTKKAATTTAAKGASTTAGAVTTAAASGAKDDKKVTIWSSIDQPVQDGLQKDLAAKLAADGITVDWQKVEDINKLIMQKIQAKDTPDIVLIPQPGVVGDMVKLGAGLPLDGVLDMAKVKASMVPGTLETGTINGKLYGLLVSMNVKSLVFYNKKSWDAKGYKAPASLDELNTLTEKIKADGGTPWCAGIESGDATGWPATDWFEDLIMRYGGVDGYNKWVKHETPFNSDLVKQAAGEFEKLMFTDGNVLGGRKAISSTSFGDAGKPMFDAAGPKCWLLKQGSFITGFFPDAIKANLDPNVGLFALPAAKAGGDNPVLGGGDLAVMLDNSPSTQKAMQALSSVDVGKSAAPGSSYLSPHKDFPVDLYKGTLNQSIAKVAYSASSFLFDGSDLMPGVVGAGTFWKDLTAWISGGQDLETALKHIDASWPKS